MTEKRRAKRLKKGAKVTITLHNQNDLHSSLRTIRHMTKDISLGGIRIQSDTFIPVNSILKIEISLGIPPRLIIGYGKVRWIKSLYEDELFEMGIEFVDTSQEIICILKRHIEK